MAKNDEVAHSFQPLMGAHGGQVADPVIEAPNAISAPIVMATQQQLSVSLGILQGAAILEPMKNRYS
jgi:hypothetical protein